MPNVSEGRDAHAVAAIGAAFVTPDTTLLDTHADPDHHRAVYTLAGSQGTLAQALLGGARVAVATIDLRTPRGHHPHVGAIDVVPIVHLDEDATGAACAEALLAADLIADELQLPVFLYGELAGGRTRAELRRGGLERLAARIADGEAVPDFGPHRLHPTAGATLLAARPPLVAFNLELAPPATVETARAIAAKIRERGPEGLPGLRAIGLSLPARRDAQGRPTAQLSMNVEHPERLPLAAIVEAVRRHAEVAAGELVGLAPRAALLGFPADVPLPGFDPERHLIENALAGSSGIGG